MDTTTLDARRSGRWAAVLIAAAVLVATLAMSSPAGAITARGQMLRETNRSREINGRAPLKINYKLSKRALRHTYEMARANRLYHSTSVPSYLSPYRWWIWGENVGYTGGTARQLQRAFMTSSAHRHNVLNRSFKKVGIGARRIDGILWVTVVFYG
jgi:uncharacterized protein YkwD